MGESPTFLGGLPLPQALLEVISAGRWKPPQSIEIIRDVFGDEPEWQQFYDLPTMARQNQFFQSKSEAELEEEVVGSNRGLGVNPSLAVLIGSLGADMPIALDYRLSRGEPRVIYLGADGWREVASDIGALCQRLRL